MTQEKPKTGSAADERVRRRYPAAYAKVAACFREKAPDEARPATAAEIEEATGFITREAVIVQILRAADWAREVSPGRFVSAEAAAKDGPGAESRPAGKESSAPEEAFAAHVKRALERETGRSRMGVSASYLRHLCGNPNLGSLQSLLDGAPWALKQFGLYRYAAEAGEESPPAAEEDAQIPLDPALMPRRAERSAEAPPSEAEAPPARTVSAEPPRHLEQLSFLPPEREREELRIGTLLYARENRREKTTAVAVDFGRDLGVKKARIPTAEAPAAPAGGALVGRQVVCRMTYADDAMRLCILTADSEEGAVAIVPAGQVGNGDRVK